MLDIMYEMQENDLKIVITEEVIVNRAEPICVYRSDEEKSELNKQPSEDVPKEVNDGDGN